MTPAGEHVAIGVRRLGARDDEPQALCHNNPDHSPETWYPFDGELDAIEFAKALCRTCPVVNACATYALEAREIHGVWGALSEAERVTIWRRQSRQNARARGAS